LGVWGVNKKQLLDSLKLSLKDLHKINKRMQRISKELKIDENEHIKNALNEIKQLIEIGEKDGTA
jgi:ribosomal protein L30/L7E